jgi:hypothetical protein
MEGRQMPDSPTPPSGAHGSISYSYLYYTGVLLLKYILRSRVVSCVLNRELVIARSMCEP